MDNITASALLRQMAIALDFLEEPFKAKAFYKAAESVESCATPVSLLLQNGGITTLPGIGASIAAHLQAWILNQDISSLLEIRNRVPSGLEEFLKVGGLGYKKIRALAERGITSLEQLSDALETQDLSDIKGFTPRQNERMKSSIAVIMSYRGHFHLDEALLRAENLIGTLTDKGLQAAATGACRRISETITQIEILLENTLEAQNAIETILGGAQKEDSARWSFYPPASPPVRIYLCEPALWPVSLFLTTGSQAHVKAMQEHAREMGMEIRPDGFYDHGNLTILENEDELYQRLGLAYIAPELREESGYEIELAKKHGLPTLMTARDIQGTIHNHTTYSDGKNSLEEMVEAAGRRGYTWIGIADHSMSARYAHGMTIKAVKQQHAEIDALQERHGVKILKGVECDIQPDGSLDYPDEILSLFDFVIASIHTRMDMDQDKITQRIITALKNPHTSMLGHPTARLLLSRAPIAADMDAVCAAALEENVIMEHNAHPWRLDLEWRRMADFNARGGMLSLSPDAHDIAGLDTMRYGIMLARKAMLETAHCINTYSAQQVLEHFKNKLVRQ